MLIILTREQWENLVPIIKQGYRAEKNLGFPVDIDNGDQKIEISVEEIKITLSD